MWGDANGEAGESMKRMQRLGFGLVAGIVIGGLGAVPATAAPEFLHEGKEVVHKTFLVKSKAATIYFEVSGTKYKIACVGSTANGKIKGTKEVEGVVIKFTGCKAKEAEESTQCEVKSTSPAGAKEEIITKTLKGKLGTVASVEAASERGLSLEATTGTVFATITGSLVCLPSETSEVKGSLVGEIKPVKTPKVKGELVYKAKEEKQQMIKKFVGELGTHELEAFEVKTPLETLATTEFEETVEVT
jgi:hypothetical protein